MNEPIISVRNLKKAYRMYANNTDRLKESIWPWKVRHSHFHSLNNINFDVRKGEHLGIIGVNGAGKSTLLQILTGVLTPTAGTVSVQGRVAALLELGAGFNPELTGRENVAFQMQIANIEKHAIEERIKEVERFAEVGNFFDQPTKLYSSGMFARVAFAANIFVSPDILIVDEALSVGDIFFQQKCLRKMKQYRECGTVIFVSHDMSSVMHLCEKALWLENGSIREYGPAKDICEHYLGDTYRRLNHLNESSDDDTEFFATENTDMAEDQADDSSGMEESCQHDITAVLQALSRSGVSDFEKHDCFGTYDCKILKCTFESLQGELPPFAPGGLCRLAVYVRAYKNIKNGIIGFIFKDKLGQYILGTNSYRHQRLSLKADETKAVIFDFILPDIQTGEYSVTLSVARGDLKIHTQMHWIHDAFSVNVYSRTNDGTIVAPHIQRLSIQRCGV